MPVPPSLSPDQRAAALDKAALARRRRAEAKEKLKMGSTTIGELFAEAEADEVLAKIKVLTLLESLPGLGKVQARHLLDEVGVADNRRVGGLGPQQRREILDRWESFRRGRARA